MQSLASCKNANLHPYFTICKTPPFTPFFAKMIGCTMGLLRIGGDPPNPRGRFHSIMNQPWLQPIHWSSEFTQKSWVFNPCQLNIRPNPRYYAPCVKRPFEWEIHGSANLTTFCCVLRVTWCHCVCFSCYLRQKRGTTNVCKLEVLTSHLV